MVVPPNLNTEFPHDPAILLLGIDPKELKASHSSIIHRQKVKVTHPCPSMDERTTIWGIYILWRGNSDIFYNMNKL